MYPKMRKLATGEVARYNVGYSYHLSLHKRDLELVKNIQNKLGIGRIYVYENKLDCRLAVNKRSDLVYLIDNVFDKYSLLTKHQLIRYLLVAYGVHNSIREFKTLEQYQYYKSQVLASVTKQVSLMPNLPLSGIRIDNWIIGFINGEGSFYLNKDKCNFFIEHTDKRALEIIKDRLSFGPNISERSPRTRDIGKKRKITYELNISSKKDLRSLIMLLDNDRNVPLQGNKYLQYIEWKKHINGLV